LFPRTKPISSRKSKIASHEKPNDHQKTSKEKARSAGGDQMIKSVNNYPVSQLFDIEASVVYAIPRYQREYTWNKSHWEKLFADVQENDPGYFLGSIICINQTTDTLAIQRLEVVDGQQRMLARFGKPVKMVIG
jgi:hypothetical protein